MGVWDSMGQGVQAGINAYLERMRQQKEGTQNQALIDLRQKELGLNQANAAREQDLIADAQARAEQEKRKAEYESESSLSIPEFNIYVRKWKDMGQGAFVPIPYDEQLMDREKQLEEYRMRKRQEEDEQMRREIAINAARPREGQKPPEDDTMSLLQRLKDPKTGKLNKAIAVALLTRRMGANMPAGVTFDPYQAVQGPEGMQRAQSAASFLATAAGTFFDSKTVYADLVGVLSEWNPELQVLLRPAPTITPQGPAPTARRKVLDINTGLWKTEDQPAKEVTPEEMRKRAAGEQTFHWK